MNLLYEYDYHERAGHGDTAFYITNVCNSNNDKS